MRVLITGATGLVGQEIVKLCHNRGVMVNYLTTSRAKITNAKNYKGFYWNPSNGEIDAQCFKDVDTIINLVGASISKRWTATYRKTILESRTKTAKLLIDTIQKHKISIKQIVSASAIGCYPYSKTKYYDEAYPETSNTFLGQVVHQWENATDAFSALNIKVCKLRIGLVLSDKGGALPEIIRPIKFGAGAAFGDGKQWQSWIHVGDLAELFLFAVTNNLSGIYNAVAPNAVTNTEFTKIAARTLKRPILLPNIPRFVMKTVLGDMHLLLFDSQRVSSQKIEQAGFSFKFPNLEIALRQLLLKKDS